MINLVNGLFGVGALIVVLVSVLVVLVGRYRTASPDQALIVSGSYLGNKNVSKDEHGNKLKIVRNGGTLILPVFQTAKALSLMSKKLDVATPEVYTEEGVPVSVDGTVIIKVGSSKEEIATAAEQYLSKSTEDMLDEAREVLEGHLRAILGGMTVEEIYKNRDKFSENVQEVASVDLAKMGLVIVSFTVKEVTDKNGYLDALGKPRIAQVKRDADMAIAEADKETRIKRAEAEQQSQEKEILRETETANFNKEKNLKLSAFKEEQDIAAAKADNAYKLEKAKLDKILKSEEVDVEIKQREKQIELEERETIRRERQYDSEIKKKADAEKYAIEQKAFAERAKSIAESEAKAKQIELNGIAEAESIRAIGTAQAEAKEKLAKAFEQYGEQAIMTLLIEAYPEMIRASAEPIGNIDKITVIDSGSGDGVTSVAGYAGKTLAATQQALQETTGLNMTGLIEQFVGTRNIGSKVENLTEVIADKSDKQVIGDDKE